MMTGWALFLKFGKDMIGDFLAALGRAWSWYRALAPMNRWRVTAIFFAATTVLFAWAWWEQRQAASDVARLGTLQGKLFGRQPRWVPPALRRGWQPADPDPGEGAPMARTWGLCLVPTVGLSWGQNADFKPDLGADWFIFPGRLNFINATAALDPKPVRFSAGVAARFRLAGIENISLGPTYRLAGDWVAPLRIRLSVATGSSLLK